MKEHTRREDSMPTNGRKLYIEIEYCTIEMSLLSVGGNGDVAALAYGFYCVHVRHLYLHDYTNACIVDHVLPLSSCLFRLSVHIHT